MGVGPKQVWHLKQVLGDVIWPDFTVDGQFF